MALSRLLFPPTERTFAGKRWCTTGLRALHLLGVAGAGSGFFYGAPAPAWTPYLHLMLGTGVALLALEAWANGIYLVQIRGIAVIVKLVAFAALAGQAMPQPWLFGTLVVASGFFSHAPARLRHYSVLHRRVVG